MIFKTLWRIKKKSSKPNARQMLPLKSLKKKKKKESSVVAEGKFWPSKPWAGGLQRLGTDGLCAF